MISSLSIFSAAAALLTPVLAQSSCNPTKGSCSPDPSLGKAVFYDFTKGSSDDWSLSTGSFPTFNESGGIFTIAKHLDSPTLSSKWYMMFGHYDIVLQIAPGQGVVSSSVLMSDDRDEVDLEWVGNQQNSLQCNYFGKGSEGSEQTVTVGSPQTEYHTYSIDWTADALQWIVDGKVLRTISPSDGNYPQTPAQLKIGTWPGGDPSEPSGTINWAGGPINYTQGPYTMIVKNVTAYDYSTGSSYAYSDTSGSMSSITSNGGKIGQYSNIQGLTVTTASMNGLGASSGSSPAASSSTAALVSSSVSAPFQVPTLSSLTNVAQSSTWTTVTTSTPAPVASPTSSPSSPAPTSSPEAPAPSPSATSTGSGSGSGSGSGTSQIPPAVQSEIAAIGKENPWLGSMLQHIWGWLSGWMKSKKQ